MLTKIDYLPPRTVTLDPDPATSATAVLLLPNPSGGDVHGAGGQCPPTLDHLPVFSAHRARRTTTARLTHALVAVLILSSCARQPSLFDQEPTVPPRATANSSSTPTAPTRKHFEGRLCPLIQDFLASNPSIDVQQVLELPQDSRSAACSYYGGQDRMTFTLFFNPTDTVAAQLGDPANPRYEKVQVLGYTVFVKTQFIGDARTNWPAYNCYVDTPQGLLSVSVQQDTQEITAYDIALGLIRAALPGFSK